MWLSEVEDLKMGQKLPHWSHSWTDIVIPSEHNDTNLVRRFGIWYFGSTSQQSETQTQGQDMGQGR